MRQTVIYVARHARPELPDDEFRFMGQADAPLGSVGVRQAQQLAERLASVGLDAVYSSDLARALVTAQIVGDRCALPVRIEPRLREIDAGLWEGLTPEQAQQRYPEEHARREADLLGCPFPGGESFHDVDRRVLAALSDIVARGEEKVLVVAHLGVNRLLLCHLLDLPLSELFSIRQHYCEVRSVPVPAAVG
jgi:broad specificity phosphatase PhoE